MKTLTKKERQEIYLKAFELCYASNGCDYLCGILSSLSGIKAICTESKGSDYSPILKAFPEFKMFKPSRNAFLWFTGTVWEVGMMERATCMLLCAEMCKD